MEACIEGDIAAVRKLLDEGRSVHEPTDEGESLLSLACSAGIIDTVYENKLLSGVLLGHLPTLHPLLNKHPSLTKPSWKSLNINKQMQRGVNFATHESKNHPSFVLSINLLKKKESIDINF